MALAGPAGLSSSELFTTVWGSRAATAERSTVTVTIHRIRQWLRDSVGDTVRLERSSSTYVLEVTGVIDVARFWELTADYPHDQADQLLEALGLWRGRALADVPPDSQDPIVVARLVRQRLDAANACAQALIRSREADHAVRVLDPLIDEYFLDEPLQAAWMQALAASGRQADALEAYERVRKHLRTELGVDPGSVLTECLVKILRGAVPAAARQLRLATAVPAQLPADVIAFTGRAKQLKTLYALPSQALPTFSPVLVMSGPGGVGKTSLAVHWAYQVVKDYPDGQLFVDLRGYSRETPVTVVEALHRFVRALGCPPDEIPADRDEASALYRSMLAGRRILIVLDNAQSADQVRQLLPGAGGCTVVITSRERLDGLTARDGALRLDLEVLSPEEAHVLLENSIGTTQIAGQHEEVQVLARTCGYLPLALRVAAAHLCRSPNMTVGGYLQEMAYLGPLNALIVDGDEQATVATAFDLSYSRVSLEAQRCYRLLALVPGADISAPAVGALIARPLAEVRSLLRTLTAAYLVSEHRPDRFSMHDLLTAHARGYLNRAEIPEEQQAAVVRLFNWYLGRAGSASDLIYAMTRLPSGVEPVEIPAFDEPEVASSWLQKEFANIVSLAQEANVRDLPNSWLLADVLRGHFVYHRLVPEWDVAVQAGFAAAERAADPAGRAAMYLSQGGLALYAAHDITGAANGFRRAAENAQLSDWRAGAAVALLSQALVDQIRGDLGACVAKLTQALRVVRTGPRWTTEVIARNNLAFAYIDQGRLRQAVSQLTRTIDQCHGSAISPLELLLETRGDAYRNLGFFDRALEDLVASIEASRSVASRYHETRSLATLSLVYSDSGRAESARATAQAARQLAREIKDRGLEDYVSLALGRAHHLLGDESKAMDAYQTILQHGDDVVDFSVYTSAMLGVAAVLREPAVVSEVLELLAGRGYRVIEGKAYGLLAALYLGDGQFAEAVAAAETAETLYAPTDHRPGQVSVLSTLAELHRRAGRESTAANCDRQAAILLKEIDWLPAPTSGESGIDRLLDSRMP
ncbi:BTAD domain-containing putative transcriptional regulator [Fodinicola feengrottensis]|uniref:BTAD domain-containing putative transcriptional regulator n=1 Tax=Fodinicola feengrottensis TaxID=435914 RepID=A0ABP4SRB9_9ACTN